MLIVELAKLPDTATKRLLDGLIEVGFTVHLAHTGTMPQYAGLKYTNDFSDTRQLAHLLRLVILPTGYIYPKEVIKGRS